MAAALYATNRWPCDGTTQRTFSFSGGYIDKAHVRAFLEDAVTRARTEIPITANMWVDPYTLSGLPAGVAGQNQLILRDTPKDVPLVDFVSRSRITEANLDKIARQTVFSAAETSDATNAAEIALLLDASGAAVNASNAAAVSASTATTQANIATTQAGTATTKAGEALASANAAAASEATVLANKAAVDTVAASIANVGTVATNVATVNAVAAEIPNLATKVSKTSDTGAAVLPHGTTAQRPATPANGYLRVNDDLQKAEVFIGGAWGSVGGGATGGGSDTVFQENSTVVTANYTVPAGKNAMTVGPLSINSGRSITVSSGQRLVIL